MTFTELDEFGRDFKKLSKKFRSLPDDIDTVKKVLTVHPDERPPFSYRIPGLNLSTCVIKIKKIACKSLKGRGVNSGLRLIYAWYQQEEKIVFVELYFKADQENENKERIKKNFK